MINKLLRMEKVLSLFEQFVCKFVGLKFSGSKPKDDWEYLWKQFGERFRKTLFELEGVLIIPLIHLWGKFL